MAEKKYRTVQFRSLVPELLVENEAAFEARRTGRPRGPMTQIKKLDEVLGGFLANGVHIIQAGPGVGKTAMALQIAATCGFPSLYITAEMPLLELFRRLIARATGTFLGKLKSGELSSKEVERLALAAVEKSPWLTAIDATAGYVEPAVIRENAIILREAAKAQTVLVVIDSLQYWAKAAGDMSDYELISAGMRACAEIAAQLSSPVIAISHRNRQGNKGDGGLYAGKGSGDLEYVAETVLELSREKDSKPDASGRVPVFLSIHKNRHGEPGKIITLEFAGRLQQFSERTA